MGPSTARKSDSHGKESSGSLGVVAIVVAIAVVLSVFEIWGRRRGRRMLVSRVALYDTRCSQWSSLTALEIQLPDSSLLRKRSTPRDSWSSNWRWCVVTPRLGGVEPPHHRLRCRVPSQRRRAGAAHER